MSTNTLSIRLPKLIKSFSKQQLAAWAKAMMIRIRNARMVARQRRMLAQLDSSQLKDIGISRYDAVEESSRGFWDIPDNLK